MTDAQQSRARGEALGLIVCRIDELRQLAACHGLHFLGYLLDVAFTESCDMIRRERPCEQDKETTQ